MKRQTPNNPHRIIHISFIVIIGGIFLYAALSGLTGNHPVPSFSQLITGENSISTGLSRSFSAILCLDFEEARRLNPYGIRIFLFFFIQFFMRIIGLLLLKTTRINRLTLILCDAMASLGLFIYCFLPFIRAMLKVL